MNREIARKLKEAGFPQEESEYYWEKVDSKGFVKISRHDENFWSPLSYDCAAPTLEEMIVKCPQEMENQVFSLQFYTECEWLAGYGGVDDSSWNEKEGIGSTPAEAVARLWIALNKK